MKKIVALIMVLTMMLSCTAFAEPAKIEFGDDNTLVYAREIAYEVAEDGKDALGNTADEANTFNGAAQCLRPIGLAHLTSWVGEWVLAAAYISEDGIEEFEFEDVEPGYYAVPENAVFLTLEAAFDASANDPSGPLVDVANYFHAHCYDLNGTLVLPEDIDEDGYKVKNVWSDWANNVRGNADGDFNFGPAKVSFKGEDDYLYWNELTGFDFEEIEEFKFIGMNLNGQIVICSATKNIVTTPDKAQIMFAYIFNPVVAE